MMLLAFSVLVLQFTQPIISVGRGLGRFDEEKRIAALALVYQLRTDFRTTHQPFVFFREHRNHAPIEAACNEERRSLP